MLESQESSLALAVPASLLLLGLLLLICARVLRQQEYLYWSAVSYALRGLALSVQFLFIGGQITPWSIPVAILFVVGVTAMAHAMAIRFGGTLKIGMFLMIGVQALVGVGIFTWYHDSMVARLVILNTALGLLYCSALPLIWNSRSAHNAWDWLIAGSYLTCCAFAFGRAAYGLHGLHGGVSGNALISAENWQLVMTGAMLFSLWFAFCLILGAVRDVMVKLRHERDSDALTGRLNRRGFQERAAMGFRAHPVGPWYLVSCDIDRFKRINDTYGHDVGDDVLRNVGRSLAGFATGPTDLAARFGGEEFVLLLQRPDGAAALNAAEAMRLTLTQLVIPPLARAPQASFGVTPVDGEEDLAAALRRVDVLLYQAKHGGRNRVIADPALLAEIGEAHPLSASARAPSIDRSARVVPLQRPPSWGKETEPLNSGRVAG